MVHVFISHIHEEAEIALAIKRFLMETVQIPFNNMMMPETLDVFVSSEPGSILPGEDWLAHVRLALASAKIVIPLLTRQSLTRPWVNFETGAAWLAKKKIIPAWCEEQSVQGYFPKPYGDWQTVHLPERADDLRRAVEAPLQALSSQPPLMKNSPAALSDLREAFKVFRQKPSNLPHSQQAETDWDVFNPPYDWDPRSR